MNPVSLLASAAPVLRYLHVVAYHLCSFALAFAISAGTLLFLSGCTVCQTVLHNFADLDDHSIFANRAVANAGETSTLRKLAAVPRFIADLHVPDEKGGMVTLEDYLDGTSTAAFVVIRDDRIIYERYGRGYDENSLLNSFSVAKSIMDTLVGIAYSEGAITSLDATVADYCPDLAATAYGPVTIRQLLTMTSGVADPVTLLPGRAQYYYGDDLRDTIARARPGNGSTSWRYSEADVQVLGFVLQKAVTMPISRYLEQKLWKRLGMESSALWALDREGGVEKAFCCVSARARDFARYGMLYLNGGTWNGERIVPAEWAARSTLAGSRTPDGYTHRHLWWHPPGDEGDFYAYGHNGQYVYVNPASRTVIVKFSESHRQDPVVMFRAVAHSLGQPEHVAQLDCAG